MSNGLSPRVRGNRSHLVRAFRVAGSIPACAGEPNRPPDRLYVIGVYPRVCGGTGASGRNTTDNSGLSPRVRGNHQRHGRRRAARRSIPACAGEPAALRLRLGFRPVYPRVCGGTRPQYRPLRTAYGLSPRVRGNLPPCTPIPAYSRSIPACAGEPLANVIEYARYYSCIEYC